MLRELEIKNIKEKEKINEFLKNSNPSEYNQSIEWNQIRIEKNKYYLYSENKSGEIVWVCSLLEKTENNESYLYAPRGPVLNYDNANTLELFFKQIKKWMLEHNYKKLVINPPIQQEMLKKFPTFINYTIKNEKDYLKLLDSCKLAIMNIEKNEEIILSKLPSKHRQNTRRSYRKNLTQKISKIIDYENFYKLYLETAERHKFQAHSIDYFKQICEKFQDNIVFLEVWYKDLPLAMSIDIVYNDKLIYLYGVSSNANRNLLGMYNLQWEAIKYCIKNKIPKYDFGGVFCTEEDINNKDYGLYKFKKGYCYQGFIDIIPDLEINFEAEEK